MRKKSLCLAGLVLCLLLVFSLTACGPTTTWTVTFSLNYKGAPDGQIVSVADGKTIDKPADPVRENYTFGGWYLNSKCSENNLYSFDTTIAEDTILYAKWVSNTAVVTFNLNYDGAATPTMTEVSVGSKVTQPTQPTRENYRFDKWCSDAQGTSTFDFDSAVSQSMTLYARWIQTKAQVKFDLNYVEAEQPAVTVDVNTVVAEPNAPVRDRYAFEGWFVDSACTSQFDFSAVITKDTTIYAKWTLEVALVTFNSNVEGLDGSIQRVEVGKTALSETLTRQGYTLDGWFVDEACQTAFDFSSAVDSDLTLYAKWTIKTLTVTFDLNYADSSSTSEHLTYGETATAPTDPVRDRYTFTGWYVDAACTVQYSFSSTVNENMTIYAGWTQSSSDCVVKFNYNYVGSPETVYTSSTYATGKRISRPADPERSENYKFFGWFCDSECTVEYDFNNRVTSDLQLYAKWVERHTFEAELTQLTGIGEDKIDKAGKGESCEVTGVDLIEIDQYNAGASGNYYVSYLYYRGAYLEFCITAAEEVNDAVLELRLTVELYDMYFEGTEGYLIDVNDGQQQYFLQDDLVGAISPSDNGYNRKRPFDNYSITTKLHLDKGENVIKLITNNQHYYGGTMNASAPMIDCVYIYTDVQLSWTKSYPENLEAIKDKWN